MQNQMNFINIISKLLIFAINLITNINQQKSYVQTNNILIMLIQLLFQYISLYKIVTTLSKYIIFFRSEVETLKIRYLIILYNLILAHQIRILKLKRIEINITFCQSMDKQ
ncbi:unnamed protein product [Paramecium sonneborni]|uniref:Transmembrane protein n=1 Tax=Paramecium sonneborni TaxID=65129 RepID=A0A8S1RU67_9CILI|nr:unnamed protein product [Paramecium sonneborni]